MRWLRALFRGWRRTAAGQPAHRPGSWSAVALPPVDPQMQLIHAADSDPAPSPGAGRVGIGFRDGSRVDLDPADDASASLRVIADRLLASDEPSLRG